MFGEQRYSQAINKVGHLERGVGGVKGSGLILYYFFTFIFFAQKPLGRGNSNGEGKKQKMLKSFLAAVLLSAWVDRFFVSRMRDFFLYSFLFQKIQVACEFVITNRIQSANRSHYSHEHLPLRIIYHPLLSPRLACIPHSNSGN